MATTPTRSVPDAGDKSQPGRKPMSKATKAKLAAALKRWRDNLTPEAKAELAERTRRKQQERWANMSERERRDALAGVKAWQRAQRAAKRAKAKAAPKAEPKADATTPATATSAAPKAARRSRKAVGS